MSLRIPLSTSWLAVVVGCWSAAPASAEEIPDLTLRYRELAGRQELKFASQAGGGVKPVGLLNWDFPPTGFATVGFENAPKTYCIEPQVPVLPGTDYPFRIDPFGQPRDFNLKADDDGKKAAARRTKFVRELYGRYYPDSVKDPAAQAAFQTALWEVVAETDVPDGPIPFSLFAGTFKADYPNEAGSPEFVRTAQRYVQSLTGDDATFADNVSLAGLELVRLTGLTNTAGAVGQSQLALRNRAGSSNITGPFGDSLAGATGGGGGLAGLGGLGNGFGRFSPLGGLGGGGGGFGGGGGGGFPFLGTGTGSGSTNVATSPSGSTPPGSDSSDGNSSPQNPNPTPPTDPNNPTPPTTPTNPVPAPPAVLLGVIAVAALGARKAFARKAA